MGSGEGSMKNVAIINLGSHDIKIKDGKEKELAELFSDDETFNNIESDKQWVQNNFDHFTKVLYDNFPKGIELVEFPIVFATMEKINQELLKEELVLEKVVFITSEQEKAGLKDTIYLGKLFELIKKDTNRKLNTSIKFSNIKVSNYTFSENPADYDMMMRRYNKIIKSNSFASTLYIGITGGTPAMNMALVYNAMNDINGKVIPIYTNRHKKVSEKLRIVEELNNNKIKRQLEILINRQLYESAEVMLNDNKMKFDIRKVNEINNMIQAAKNRREFNFNEAIKILEEVKYEDIDSRTVCDEFENIVEKLQNKNSIYLLNEVKNNAIYKYKSGSYTDFLGRIFRIQEEVYRLVLKKNNLIKMRIKDEEWLNCELLTSEQIRALDMSSNGELRYKECQLNTYSMSEIIKVVIDKGSSEYKVYSECDRVLTGLKEQRNKSILAHGYKGTTKSFIDEHISDVEKFLDNIVETISVIFGEEYDKDGFYSFGEDNKYNQYIIKLIKEL